MKIYNHSGYGHASIICSPGNDDPVDPQREEWHELVPTPEGRIRKVRSICVKFAGGVAEVSDALGEYMVAQGYAGREPPDAPIMAPAAREHEWNDDGRPRYAKPIEVGKPYNPDERAYLSEHRRDA